MIRSMTGFGSAQVALDGWSLSVDCRSVNQKALEAKIYLPRQLSALEPAILDAVKSHLQRGRVDVRIEAIRADASHSDLVHRERFSQVASQLRELAADHGLAEVKLSDVLGFRDVLASGDSHTEIDHDLVLQAAHAAVEQLVRSREEEGQKLRTKLHELIDTIRSAVDRIEGQGPRVVDEFRTKLEARVREALDRFGVHEIDEQRLLQEVILYADRSDIAEEIQRTRSHLAKLEDLLDTAPDEPCGKRLDFYLQELFREANTMGSKSSATELTDAVVLIKATIEQMREQAANIE